MNIDDVAYELYKKSRSNQEAYSDRILPIIHRDIFISENYRWYVKHYYEKAEKEYRYKKLKSILDEVR